MPGVRRVSTPFRNPRLAMFREEPPGDASEVDGVQLCHGRDGERAGCVERHLAGVGCAMSHPANTPRQRGGLVMQGIRVSCCGLPLGLLVALVSTSAVAQVPTPEPVTDQETELGKATYDQLRKRAGIIQSSPLYDNLKPIADAIAKVAQSRYPHPFKFYLVHEAQPNAFATPGGNVYVVDSLLHFVKNTEQLAGTLCHEVSHTIHRDSITLLNKNRHLTEAEVAGAILVGATRAGDHRPLPARPPAVPGILARRRVQGRPDRLGHLR